jgi:SAM-dependent methyltransferase
MSADARVRFLDLVEEALNSQSLIKLTLGKPQGGDPELHNVFVRLVSLKAGPHAALLWRYKTRDVTKNLPMAEAAEQISALIGREFLDAHLFTPTQTAQLQTQPNGSAKLRTKIEKPSAHTSAPALASSATHDRAKTHLIPSDQSWLRALGVTNDRGQPREGMADKFRQIQKFAELLSHTLSEIKPPSDRPLQIADMGCGKGYLTFAVAALLGERAVVTGIESRPELVALCNEIARSQTMSERLRFVSGSITETPVKNLDVLIALHACDTATDDALAKGIAAGAQLLVVSPCCQKELRHQLSAPPVLVEALRHGIFQERQAEFVTDSLRAQLLEWAGFRTKVFEFISTEHTAKNLMITAIRARSGGRPDDARAEHIREFARFYGIRRQALAQHLNLSLIP